MIQENGFVENGRGRRLYYEYAHPDDLSPVPCLIGSHGYGGHHRRPYMQAIKEMAQDIGCATLMFDLTGCGRSEGRLGDLTPKTAVADWKAVMAFSKTLPGVDQDQRAAFGTSFSANALAQYAASDDADTLKALILHVPVPKPKKIVNFMMRLQVLLKGKDLGKMAYDDIVQIGFGGLDLHVSRAFDEQMRDMNLYKDTAPRITTPVTIIGGGKDALVAPEKLEKLRDSFPDPTKVTLDIIKKAGHSFTDKQLDKMATIGKNALLEAFPALSRQPLLKAI